LVEIVRGVVEVRAPVEPQPAHVRLDRVDVLLLLLERVGVVEAEVAVAAELARKAEVQADRLRVADVQVAVGLGREARHHRLVLPGAEILRHDLPDEIAGGGFRAHAAGLSAPRTSIARRRRRRTTSLPSTASVAKRGGVATRPVAATRTAMNASFALQPAASANERRAASIAAASHSSSGSTWFSSRAWNARAASAAVRFFGTSCFIASPSYETSPAKKKWA